MNVTPPAALLGSGKWLCTHPDCLTVGSSASHFSTGNGHVHERKPSFDLETYAGIYYNPEHVTIPRGFEHTTLRIDHKHNVAVCLARNMAIPRKDVKLHVKYCSFCNSDAQLSELDLLGTKDRIDFQNYSKVYGVNPVCRSKLPEPVSGSKQHVMYLCLDCIKTGWHAIVPTSASKKRHEVEFHGATTCQVAVCMFSEIKVESNYFLFPNCQEINHALISDLSLYDLQGVQGDLPWSLEDDVPSNFGALEEIAKLYKDINSDRLFDTLHDQDFESSSDDSWHDANSEQTDFTSSEKDELTGNLRSPIIVEDDLKNSDSENIEVLSVKTSTFPVSHSHNRLSRASSNAAPINTKVVSKSTRRVLKMSPENSAKRKPFGSPSGPMIRITRRKISKISIDAVELLKRDREEESIPMTPMATEVPEIPSTPDYEVLCDVGPLSPSTSRSYSPIPDPTVKAIIQNQRCLEKPMPVSSDMLKKLTALKSEHETMIGRIMSLAHLYYQACLADVIQDYHLDILDFIGIHSPKGDFKKIALTRQFVGMIGIIFRSYLKSTVELNFSRAQREAMDAFIDASKRCDLEESMTKAPLMGYENVEYENLWEKLDLSSDPAQARIELMEVFVDHAKFGYASQDVEQALVEFHKLLAHFLEEESGTEAKGRNFSRWNVLSSALVLQLHSEGKAMEPYCAIDCVEASLFNWRLMALRQMMECCDAHFMDAPINPWFVLASSPRDAMAFIPMYTILDELMSVMQRSYTCRSGTVEGRMLDRQSMQFLGLKLVHNLLSSVLLSLGSIYHKARAQLHNLQLAETISDEVGASFLKFNYACNGLLSLNCVVVVEAFRAQSKAFKALRSDTCTPTADVEIFLQGARYMLDDIAALLFLTCDLEPKDLVNLSYANPAATATRSLWIDGETSRLAVCNKQLLPWFVSELIVHYLTMIRPLEIELCRCLEDVPENQTRLLSTYLFVGPEGLWNKCRIAELVPMVTKKYSRQPITPLVWRALRPVWNGMREEWVSKMDDALHKELMGVTILPR